MTANFAQLLGAASLSLLVDPADDSKCVLVLDFVLVMKSTKELARELGFLRKRSVSNSLLSNEAKSQNSSCQPFLYLIVLDFESTCWKDCKYKTQEIIEFPCVLLNTWSGQIESEFQYYVQPSEHPVLSDFCKQLTGITQDQVEQGIPLSLCLKKFDHWISRLHKEKGVTFTVDNSKTVAALTTIVTWSDWDLGVCLQYECRRKQIRKQPVFNSWIDLRATYRKFYSRKPQGLNGALQDVGIKFEGREHSGLCDARNTARLAWRMIKDGCVMSITKTMKLSSCGRSEMVPAPIGTESVFSKTSVRQNHEVQIGKSLNRIPTTVNDSLHDHGTEAFHIHCDGTEPPKAKMCRIKSPRKPNVIAVESCQISVEKFDMRNNNVDQVSHTTSGGIMRNNNTESVSHTAGGSTGENNLDRVSHTAGGVIMRNNNVDQVSHTAGGVIMRNNNVDQVSHTAGGVIMRNNNVDQVSHTAGGVIMRNNNVDQVSHTAGGVIMRNNNTESVLHTAGGLTGKHNNENRASHTVMKNMLKHISTSESSEFISPIVLPRPCSRTPLQTLKNASIIQTPIVTPLTYKSKSSAVTPHSASSTLATRPVCTFKTPSPVTAALVNKSASTTTTPTPQSVSKTWTMKSTPPLCKCGRRSKRRLVQSPGPNIGRFFFSCGQGRGFGNRDSGCGFFQWEKESIPKGRQLSRLGHSVGKPYTPVLNMNRQLWSGVIPVLAKRQLGVHSSQNAKCLR
ncbi:ERI1 exoribonuclease 2-like [Gigantopelta aegis]|uniref:ERI1 exoribonuclease 2-like n=1 Tax=Gigantopelta aegis TaxID=1735272 RepID=UPI001B88A3C8|nr:ERI1 exoribonuclease 2-like [Gigantopelta aegis]